MSIMGTGGKPSQFSIEKSGKPPFRRNMGCIFEDEKAFKMWKGTQEKDRKG